METHDQIRILRIQKDENDDNLSSLKKQNDHIKLKLDNSEDCHRKCMTEEKITFQKLAGLCVNESDLFVRNTKYNEMKNKNLSTDISETEENLRKVALVVKNLKHNQNDYETKSMNARSNLEQKSSNEQSVCEDQVNILNEIFLCKLILLQEQKIEESNQKVYQLTNEIESKQKEVNNTKQMFFSTTLRNFRHWKRLLS